MDTLEIGHRYLVKNFLTGVTELKCVEISETSYKIRFENKNTMWVTKTEVNYWAIVEDLGCTMFSSDKDTYDSIIKFVNNKK